MTDTVPDDATAAETGDQPDATVPDEASDPGDATASAPSPSGRDAMTYVQWAAFVVLSLLALVATVRFYTAASRAISIWISPDFEPFFQAGFNLVVLAAAAIGLSLLARRLRG